MLRGVIDLAFLETGGWVLVDYKTDVAARDQLEMLVEHFRPQVDLYGQVSPSSAKTRSLAALFILIVWYLAQSGG